VTDPSRPDAANDDLGATPRQGRQTTAAADERRELDHRLANSLQLAADFLIFAQLRVRDAEARTVLIETADRLSAVGQMHRFLAVGRGPQVDLAAFLAELGELIADSTGLVCDVDAEPVEVPGEVAQHLAIAVNELAMNAAKHAYPWGERGPLHIACRRLAGQRLRLTVADEGRGLGETLTGSRPGGLGMAIVQAVMRQLNGLFEATSDNGARFTLTVPLPEPARPASRSFAPPGDKD
jgi:two-component system, sensor histidine kinase PdtaS